MEAGGLYYEEHGAAGAPPLILSAGMGGSGKYWLPNLPELAARFRVILYDHRGTGRSDRTVTPRIESIGDDIRLLMDALGIEKASILGHAIGGMGGLHLALDAPERVDRLVVVNGWGRLDPYTARCFDARLALLRAYLGEIVRLPHLAEEVRAFYSEISLTIEEKITALQRYGMFRNFKASTVAACAISLVISDPRIRTMLLDPTFDDPVMVERYFTDVWTLIRAMA